MCACVCVPVHMKTKHAISNNDILQIDFRITMKVNLIFFSVFAISFLRVRYILEKLDNCDIVLTFPCVGK